MWIYNNKLSVSPVTTHLPLSEVKKKYTTNKIIKNVLTINSFYKKKLKKNPNLKSLDLILILKQIKGTQKKKKIIIPAIKKLREKKININGTFPTDTLFLKKNIKKFNVVIGIYHDQVLTPIKTLYRFEAININMGLPFEE